MAQSLAKKFLNATLVALGVSTAFAANAAEVKELGQIDMSRPIPAGTCVADSASGSAYDKLQAIKQARGQTNVIEANEVGRVSPTTGSPNGEIIFTSTLKAVEGKRSIFGEGYGISSNRPKGQKGSVYCVDYPLDSTQLFSAINGSKVPSTVNVGEMGIGLTNAMNNAQSKVGFVAVTSYRTLLAVDFNYNTKKGTYTTADGGGNKSMYLPLVDVDYSLELPIGIQKALGVPLDKLAQRPPINNGTQYAQAGGITQRQPQ